MQTQAPAQTHRPATADRPRLGYRKAFDGWRGVCISAVVLYHAGAQAVLPGAFLWVDGFFTLSAFLISTLLLEELDARGRIRIGAFWGRRVRRLAPALAATLAGMALFALVADRTQRANLNADVLATLFYANNWRSIAAGTDYFAGYASASPLKTAWSLSIEEQFYLLFPLALIGLAVLARRLRRDAEIAVGVLACTGAIVSLLWMAALHADGANVVRLYYGTDTRAQALLIGVLAAVLWRRWGERLERRGRAVLRVMAAAAFASLLLAQFLVDEKAEWLYQGGFALGAVIQSVVFVGILVPGGLTRVLSWGPLVRIGTYTYGLYLAHWPICCWLTPERTGLDPLPLTVLRIAVTFAVVVPFFHLVEVPVREQRWRILRPPFGRALWPLAIAGVVSAAIVWVPASAQPSQADLAKLVTPVPTGPPDGSAPATSPRPAPRVAVVGDSSGNRLAGGVEAWGNTTGLLHFVGDGSRLGCPVGRGGMIHTAADAIGPVISRCDWATPAPVETNGVGGPAYGEVVRDWTPDLVVLSFGLWDIADRNLRDGTWRGPGDPSFDTWLLDEMTAATDTLTVNGATAVWLTSPPWEGATRHRPDRLYAPSGDPARMATYNRLVARLAERRPRNVVVIDYAGWIAGTGDDAHLRPDGAHLEPETAVEVMNRFLGQALLNARARD
jgi:peptidoglycan/LPS O-acetylase OafA/YrhL